MADFSHLGRRLRPHLMAVLGLGFLGYLGFHAVQGERGVFALRQIQSEIETAEATLEQVRGQRVALETRASRLRSESLDLDLLEERARAVLNYAHPDEIVIQGGPVALTSAEKQ